MSADDPKATFSDAGRMSSFGRLGVSSISQADDVGSRPITRSTLRPTLVGPGHNPLRLTSQHGRRSNQVGNNAFAEAVATGGRQGTQNAS